MFSVFILFGFTSKATIFAWGTSSDSSSKTLGRQLNVDVAEAGEVAIRPSQAGDEAGCDRVTDASEDDRDRRGGILRGQRRCRGDGRDHINLAADEIRGQSGQPIVIALRPAVFDRDVLALDVAGFVQSLEECSHEGRRRTGRSRVEEADHRHHLLLRSRGGWPSTHCAGE
jgi:hypothetical protein